MTTREAAVRALETAHVKANPEFSTAEGMMRVLDANPEAKAALATWLAADPLDPATFSDPLLWQDACMCWHRCPEPARGQSTIERLAAQPSPDGLLREALNAGERERRIRTIESRLFATLRRTGMTPTDARSVASQVRDEITALTAASPSGDRPQSEQCAACGTPIRRGRRLAGGRAWQQTTPTPKWVHRDSGSPTCSGGDSFDGPFAEPVR